MVKAMLRRFNNWRRFREIRRLTVRDWWLALGLICAGLNSAAAGATREQFTNLRQVVQATEANPHVAGDVHLTATVCAVAGPHTGIVVARDDTAAELLDLGPQVETLVPGEQIIISLTNCLLRRRDFGVQINAAPVVDNDGIHSMAEAQGEATLAAGRHPLTVEWFNGFKEFGLGISCAGPDSQMQPMAASNLWRKASDNPGLAPGLVAECYEGTWKNLPDFNLLTPVRTGAVTNFDLGFRTRDERVGMRFSGFFEAPIAGKYAFHIQSDDGAMVFLGDTGPSVKRLGMTAVPVPANRLIGEPFGKTDEQAWIAVEGRGKFVTQSEKGLEFQLFSGYPALLVRVADASTIRPQSLVNARLRVAGIGRGVRNIEGQTVLGEMCLSSGRDVEMLEAAAGATNRILPLTTAEQVQSLRPEDAERQLPVKIRGVITFAPPRFDNGASLQDGTKGIYIKLEGIPNWIAPAVGEFWEVEGHTGPGDFAPVVIAEKMNRLGTGQLPEPAHPSWSQLVNGSMDVQWVEFQGLVTGVGSNALTMLMPEGSLNVQVGDSDEHDLSRFRNAVIRIRGTLLAGWDAATHEVRVGSLQITSARISVDRRPPADFSDAVRKSIHDLLLFDAQATAFQRVKISGQIVHDGAGRFFLQQGDSGLRIFPAEISPTNIEVGDLVSAIGYPTIAGASPTLREAFVQKIGHAALPAPKILGESDLKNRRMDSLFVRVDGRLNGWHQEGNAGVLEMQSGSQPFSARLESGEKMQTYPRVGSRLGLVGVYFAQGGGQLAGGEVAAFELLLNSPADIVVRSQPSWWTLQRMLGLVGVLLFSLMLTGVWITQLRRQVEHHTTQLKCEIRDREQAERLRALEAERARIARDLHDDLGSSLAEIAMLSKTRPLAREGDVNSSAVFDLIAERARRLIAALDVIVWAVDPDENSLQSLTDYFNGFVDEYLSHHGIVCRFDIPVEFPDISLDGNLRHDLFLAVKEALHNIVRHSGAREVQFGMALAGNVLEIVIADNGKGFESTVEQEGHGVKNLCNRLEKLGGNCRIDSRAGMGTTVRFQLLLPLPPRTAGNGFR
jgi:signal transduction histidine kinase